MDDSRKLAWELFDTARKIAEAKRKSDPDYMGLYGRIVAFDPRSEGIALVEQVVNDHRDRKYYIVNHIVNCLCLPGTENYKKSDFSCLIGKIINFEKLGTNIDPDGIERSYGVAYIICPHQHDMQLTFEQLYKEVASETLSSIENHYEKIYKKKQLEWKIKGFIHSIKNIFKPK